MFRRFKPPGISSRRCGFTLIELMSTFAVIGALTAISIPNYMNYKKKAEYAALIRTLDFLMDAQDFYFMENDAFFPENGRINIRSRIRRSIPELNYTFPAGHKHRYIIYGRNAVNRKGRKINTYWIDVRCDLDLDGNGKKDRVRFSTLYRDDKVVRYRALRRFR